MAGTLGLVAMVSALTATAAVRSPTAVVPPALKPAGSGAPATSPIRHVVVVFQENHSFDNVLGRYCVKTGRCNGTTQGRLHDGTIIPLKRAMDIVPVASHSHSAQVTEIDGGKMDGFDLTKACDADNGYRCYQQFTPGQNPNVTALAKQFALSDDTFETNTTASWGSHLALLSSVMDGFLGDNPIKSQTGHEPRPGWGCDSFRDADWQGPGFSSPKYIPSCVPDQEGRGPYRSSPARNVPTIMDRLDPAGLSWKLYAGLGPGLKTWNSGYFWQACATFYECLSGSQLGNWVPASNVVDDATGGTLPAVSLVTPTVPNSQHNEDSMLQGDNWIGKVVGAVENGPQWSSTAIFVTWDDCGCFYDHVPPPSGTVLGLRVPLLIVSPYARPRFTDSNTASLNSVLAFIEHTFGLAPLSSDDANAYDYADSFNFSQQPVRPVRVVTTPISPSELRWLREHPGREEDT